MEKQVNHAFALYKPSAWAVLWNKGIMSESFAWACQNALGLIFTVLFAFVDSMTFTLACICAALYGASSQVLSLDRSIGGRLFAGTIFVGTVLSGGVVGFTVVSLSWLARGSDVKGVLEFLPSELEKVPSRTTIGEFKVADAYLQQYLLVPVANLISLVDDFLNSTAGARLEAALPVPLPPPGEVLQDVETLIEGIEEEVPAVSTAYWVLLIILYFVLSFPFAFSRGMVKSFLGLVLAIATLFMSSQVVFGSLMPIFGQRLFWTQVTGGYLKVACVNVGAMVIAGMVIFVQSAHDSVRTRLGSVMISCGKCLTGMASKQHGMVSKIDASTIDEASQEKIDADYYMKEAQRFAENATENLSTQLQVETFEVESALVTCLFEPPLPGLVSQPGQNRYKYDLVLKGVRRVISIISNLETSYIDGTRESTELSNHEEFSSAVSVTLASSAAVLQSAAVVLQDMPVFKKCHGPSLVWRPQEKSMYSNLEARLTQVYDLVKTSSLGYARAPEDLVKGSSAFITLTSCISLVQELKVLEGLIADALEVPFEGTLEKRKDATKREVKDLILMDSWAPSFVLHTCLLSSLLVWGLIAQGMKLTYDYWLGTKSKIPWRRKREVHFALKYWIALSLAVMAIILIFWQGKGDDANPVRGYASMADFFFNWQPVYFTITAAICTQMQVESSAGKAVLRTTMTVLGGLLGYLTMLNGSLAQNPYFITCIACLVNGACGLLSPMKELRYSLFLTAFTFNAVVICQYYGCCSIAGTALNFGGKVVSTMLGSIFAIIVSWCFLPFYTSEKMLELESSAMEHGLKVVKDVMHLKTNKESSSQASNVMDTVIKDVYTPLSDVVKEYKTNTIDKKQFMLLTYTLLPTPPVVMMLLKSLGRMTSYLHESANLMKRSSSDNMVDMDDTVAALLQDIKEDIDEVLTSAKNTYEACSDAMLARSTSHLRKARETVKAASLDFASKRAHLADSFSSWLSKNSIDSSSQNLEGLISLELLLHALREIQVSAFILSDMEEATLRDYQFSWLSSWFGRRPLV